MSLLSQRLAVLSESANKHLVRVVKGLEKESLRVSKDGTLAETPHPQGLGSALTHPEITTDYSEALLEFITEPKLSTDEILADLDRIQNFTYRQLQDEYLWGASMPCMLGGDNSIPVAKYGKSNPGLMKTVYRLGLGERYGRSMQTIAGIHYNFSLQDEFWDFWRLREAAHEDLQTYKNRRYFDLIRNFRRNFWLLLYFFGASPAVCRSFVKGRDHQLVDFGDDSHSLHLPYATSLRMGNLGYQSDAQSSLVVCYNNLATYIQTLCEAITQPYSDYEDKGIRDSSGNYKQLNTGLLQIENEFYSTIRPKCVANSGETALGALNARGVEYIEVRCIDLNPYERLGISAEQINFMDVFLVYCLLAESPETDQKRFSRAQENQRLVVNQGRDTDMRLHSSVGEQSLCNWGEALLDEMQPVANLMDASYDSTSFSEALTLQRQKLRDPELTPSARILSDMKAERETYFRFAMNQSIKHAETYRDLTLSTASMEQMEAIAAQSLVQQSALEAEPQLPFDEYVRRYYLQYNCRADIR